jgi:hypothetical protein
LPLDRRSRQQVSASPRLFGVFWQDSALIDEKGTSRSVYEEAHGTNLFVQGFKDHFKVGLDLAPNEVLNLRAAG